MVLKGAIFDLDGVIVNTVPLHFKAWKAMFSDYKKDFTFEDYKNKVDGIPRIDGAKAILTDLSAEELEKAAAKKQIYFLQLLEKEGINVYESTVKLVKEFYAQQIKRAVISSSKNCLPILRKARLVDLFDVIITGNDISRGKPNPDIFLLAAQRLYLEPQECIVFEDAVLGVEAAKRAGMKCIGIDRYNNPQRLSKADYIVKDLSELNAQKIKEIFSR